MPPVTSTLSGPLPVCSMIVPLKVPCILVLVIELIITVAFATSLTLLFEYTRFVLVCDQVNCTSLLLTPLVKVPLAILLLDEETMMLME